MAYVLAGLIGDRRVLAQIVAELPAARLVDLAAGMTLLPLTEPVLGQVPADEPGDAAALPGFAALTPSLARLAARSSKTGPLLHAEAEFHGGNGSQAAIAWRDGQISFGPLLTQDASEGREDEGFVVVQRPHDHAINAGLRHLGVRAAPDAADEFDMVGLGRHRFTDEWS